MPLIELPDLESFEYPDEDSGDLLSRSVSREAQTEEEANGRKMLTHQQQKM